MYNDASAKVMGVVVTYNRKELLVKNIEMQLKQTYPLEKIILVDNNSTDGTEEYLSRLGYLNNERIFYLKLDENIGGAGGFYTGTKTAYELGADAIWLMDDDGRPNDKYALEVLLKKVVGKELYLVNSLVKSSEKELSFTICNQDRTDSLQIYIKDGVIKNAVSAFNGTLVSKELVAKIGYPNKDFFIKGDETDYTIRAINAGAYVATIVDSLYFHPKLDVQNRVVFGRKVSVSVEQPWKEYYRARNYTYMYKQSKAYKGIIYELLILKLYSIIFFSKEAKMKEIYYVIKGIKDGLQSNLGKRVLPS